MTLWVLDTDQVSLWQRNHANVVQRIAETNPKSLVVTVVTLEEQLRGRLNAINQATSAETLVLAYSRLQDTYLFFKELTLLEFSHEAELLCSQLIQQRIRIGTRDLRIAAIALSVGGIVVTRNQRDFGKIPGLQIEDWAIA
jgi:tRNA(fMet)-specific endonuclease VapC